MLPKQFIKGFAVSRSKLAALLNIDINSDHIETAIVTTIRCVDRDAYLFLACGVQPGQKRRLVIVLDVDNEEGKLRERPLKPLDSSIEWIMQGLEGPDVWERVA